MFTTSTHSAVLITNQSKLNTHIMNGDSVKLTTFLPYLIVYDALLKRETTFAKLSSTCDILEN